MGEHDQECRGWTGRVLRVDLSARTLRTERPDPDLYRRFLGGRGLGAATLAPFGHLPWDHPDAPVTLFTGPLTATIAPTSGRACLSAFSPQTGTLADSSLGGRLPTQLKRAGWDGIIVTGRADAPLGLEIKDQDARLADAGHLAGQPTSCIFDALTGFASAACIGPAAWNGVRYAALVVDRHHAAGRTGLGLALAARNLAYLAVTGTGRTPVADKAELKAARQEIVRLTMASPALMGQQGFACYGTASLFDLMDARRMMPTDNFTRSRFEGASKANAHAYMTKYRPVRAGCMGCHIQCKKVLKEQGSAMPEFETMSHFTALIGNHDLDLVLAANRACNELGLDTISAASTLACLRELRGRDFGPGEVLALLEDTAQGRAPELAGGARALVRSHGDSGKACPGSESGAAMAVKGLELSAYDPRGAYGMALAYAVSTRGGCHLRAYPVSHEILRKPVATDRFTFAGKARMVKIAEDQNAAVDSLIACKFTFFAATLEEYARALNAVTGAQWGAQDLLRLGERICYLERMVNAARGFCAADDDLPCRFFTDGRNQEGGVQEGGGQDNPPLDNPPLDRMAFLAARSNYYKVRGLDQDGLPMQDKAEQLGLGELWTLF